MHAAPDWNPRSVMNYSMQANGAEMRRLACCLATEQGLAVCAPVHDAIMIEAPAAEIEEHVAALQASMREASRPVRRSKAFQIQSLLAFLDEVPNLVELDHDRAPGRLRLGAMIASMISDPAASRSVPRRPGACRSHSATGPCSRGSLRHASWPQACRAGCG
jgi:hypothetical protein